MVAKKEKLTLMYQNEEVLSFSVDLESMNFRFEEKLEAFDKAPYGILHSEDLNQSLLRFFNGRAIPPTRVDYEQILQATGAKDGLSLSFKGHGLSLSNHYWFRHEGENLRYEDISFFHNGWDDSFGKAVLSGNYEALKTCDLNVPDIVTSGWGVKGWLNEDRPRLYKLGIDETHPEEAICEVLASRIGRRLFPKDVLDYELREISGRYASVSESVINEGEELVPMSAILPSKFLELYRGGGSNKEFSKEFFLALKSQGRKDLYDFFAKVAVLRSLCFIGDLHADNLCAIRNVDTGEIRLAPIMDLGGAFGSSKTGRDTIAHANRGTLFLIYFLYGSLNPEWDYSWYESRMLDGVEEEIEDYLSKSTFYTPEIISCALTIYHQQKKALEEAKEKHGH